MKFEEAVKIVTKQLKRDKELYRTYEATIALQFFDEVNRKKINIDQETLMKMSTNAAKNFLDLWIE